MLPILVLTHGIPGSGKSTAAAELAERFPGMVVVTERDQIRAEILPADYHEKGHDPASEMIVETAQYAAVIGGLAASKMVVVADTNVDEPRIRRLVKIARELKAIVLHIHFDIDPDESKRRAADRAAAGGRATPDWCIDGFVDKAYHNGRLDKFKINHLGAGPDDFEVISTPRNDKMSTTDEEISLITWLLENSER